MRARGWKANGGGLEINVCGKVREEFLQSTMEKVRKEFEILEYRGGIEMLIGGHPFL